MSPRGDFTAEDVPQDVLGLVISDARIYADVVKAGPMIGTGLDEERAEDKGLVKNHWYWRATISFGGSDGQVQIGYNTQIRSIPSNEGQYYGSSRIGGSESESGNAFSAGTGSVYSAVESDGKPPELESIKEGTQIGVAELCVQSDSIKAGKPSDILPPDHISSTDGSIIYQLTEGAPVEGFLEVKLRPRTIASWLAYRSFSFELKVGTTVGDLLRSITSRPMQPFMFRKIGGAFLGCRNGMSQVASVWMEDGWMANPPLCNGRHFFDILCWRYSMPAIDPSLTDTSSSGSERVNHEWPSRLRSMRGRTISTGLTQEEKQVVKEKQVEEEQSLRKGRGFSASLNPIDRAIWPNEYVHRSHPLLQYNLTSKELSVRPATSKLADA